jgi:hypothetical protein
MKQTILTVGVSILALTGLWAQAKKKFPILQPQMTVENGKFDAPMGKMGEKPSDPWSPTTMGASVDGKPNPAKITTLVGEIVDFSCYLLIGKHGEKHRACGQKCINNGQPAGLLTSDGNLYMLMEEEHDPRRDGQTMDFRKAISEHTAHIMEVTGTLASHAGYSALYVHGFVKK